MHFFRILLIAAISIVVNTAPLLAEWEVVIPNPRVINLQTIDDTWYAFEYWGTGGSVFIRSEDNGHTWDTMPGFTDIFKLRTHKEKILVFGIYEGIRKYYLSTDKGQTWKGLDWPITAAAGSTDMLMTDSAIFISVKKSIYVESPVYRSLDWGKTWHPLPIDTEDKEYGTDRKWEGLCEYQGKICAFVGQVGFFISNDGGNSWEKTNGGFDITDAEMATVYDAPMHSSVYGLYINLKKKWYKFNGASWEQLQYKAYYFEPSVNDWREFSESQYPSLSVRDIRPPYMFANSSEGASGYVMYSLDWGKTWYRFTDYVYTNAWGSSIKLHGNFVYSGMNQGFARRSLSEAVQHKIDKKKEISTSPSPESVQNLLSLIGAGSIEDLLDALGIDSDELSNEELSDFLEDYFESDISSDLFSNSQPGTCSFMGMPAWSLNITNLKLFFRDVIYRKKGLGPEVKLAMNYGNSSDISTGIFGRNWKFEYETMLMQHDTCVELKTSTGATYIFSNGSTITNGGSTFTLPLTNGKSQQLHWTGSQWRLEKGYGYEFVNFAHAGGNTYRLASIEDGYGKLLSLSYNASNQPIAITDAAGRVYSLSYSNGRCESIVSPTDLSAHFTYNANGMLIQSTDFDGVVTRYQYDDALNITNVDISGKETLFSYSYGSDTLGRLQSITDPVGRTITYAISPIDSITHYTNVVYNNRKVKSYCITDERITSITNPVGETKYIYYDAAGRADSLVWVDGTYTTLKYDTKGDMVQKRERDGTIYQYRYSSTQKLVFMGDVAGDTIYAASYNNHNQITAIKQKDTPPVKYGYNTNGALTSVTTPEGNTYLLGRDAFGNINGLTNPSGASYSISYDAKGLYPSGQTDFNGNSYSFSYDANGKLTSIGMPDGSSRGLSYDCCAQNGIIDENGNVTQVTRDASNRIVQRTSQMGNVYSINYDVDGYIASFETRFGTIKTLNYSDDGKLTSITDDEGKTNFKYTPHGQLNTITDKKGYTTSFAYNANYKLSGITDALGKTSLLQYTHDGLLQSFTNARNQVTGISYNSQNLAAQKSLNGTIYASFTYNHDGKLISFTDSSGTTTYHTNNLGFVNDIQYTGNLHVIFEYDANGNVSKITYPNGMEVNYATDDRNRITNIDWGQNSIDLSYDAAGNLLSESHSNGTTSEYIYNGDNSIINLQHYNTDSVFFSEAISFNNGIISQNNMKIAAPVSRIPNKLNNMYYNQLHQPVAHPNNDVYFLYDEDGNQQTFYHKSTRMMSAQYSHDNLLTYLDSPEGKIQLKYNALRYPSSLGTIKMFYDHKGRLLFETTHDGQVTRMNIYRGKRLMATINNDNQVYFYHYSRQGHTIAITNEQGQIANAYTYTAHGEIIGKKENLQNRFTFLGAFGAIRLTDSYILTGARVYCPLLGRYIQRDPLSIFTGNNPYLYAANNPVSGIDPLGFDDAEATINTLDFDPPSDNAYSTAGGTADPYADGLPYRSNDWDTYGSAAFNTAKDVTNHPLFDFVPDCVGNPVSVLKAIDKLANKEYGGALWQFVPFNNSMEAAGDYLNEKMKYIDPSKSSGLGIFGEFNQQKTFSCEL